MDTRETQKALEQGRVLIQMPLHPPEFQEPLLSALMKESVGQLHISESQCPARVQHTDKRPRLALGYGTTLLHKPTTERQLPVLPALVRTAPDLSPAALAGSQEHPRTAANVSEVLQPVLPQESS